MRTAILEVRGTKGSVRIELRYYYWSSNRWSCLPGYMRASKGYWHTDGSNNTIDLYDDDDELVATGHYMDVQHLGYPFDGLDGDTGPFWVFPGGRLYRDAFEWRFLDV
jgi:hypothetical protein